MAKRVGAMVLDAALNYIKNNCNKQVLCSAEPTTFTEANATYALADVAMASGDYTVAAGDGGGTSRKVTMAAKSGVTVDAAGTSTHDALVNTTGSELCLVTTTPSTALSTPGTVDIGSWKYEISSPT